MIVNETVGSQKPLAMLCIKLLPPNSVEVTILDRLIASLQNIMQALFGNQFYVNFWAVNRTFLHVNYFKQYPPFF